MWVLYFQGKSSFWLTGSQSYTIGRKDTDIVVVDDASISRCHVTMEVGASVFDRVDASSTPRMQLAMLSSTQTGASPKSASHPSSQPTRVTTSSLIRPSLRITDSSKYGSSVSLVHKDVGAAERIDPPLTLDSKTPFDVPSNVNALHINLGTHGMTFFAVYEPLIGCISNIPEMSLPGLEKKMSRLGFHAVRDPAQCDLFFTEVLEPTQDLVVALCMGKPIVVPAYLEAVLARKSCKVPLPEAGDARFLPRLDPFWLQLASCGEAQQDASAKVQELFLPKKERRYLFADMTFVCVQQSLYDEVGQYLTAARGRVVLDRSLWEALPTERGAAPPLGEPRAKLHAFCLRHQRHILLYTTADSLPASIETITSLLNAGDARAGLKLVDYAVVLKSILLAQRIVSTPPLETSRCEDDVQQGDIADKSDVGLTRATTVATMSPQHHQRRGRKTGNILFDEELERDQGAAVVVGDTSWRTVSCGADHDEHRLADSNGEVAEERMSIHTKLRLPPYPCFLSFTSSSKGAHVIGASGKLFQKQPLTVSSRLVDYEPVRPTSLSADNLLTSRVARIDAANLFDDDVVDVLASENRFNAFDTAEQHTASRRRVTVKKAPAPTAKKTRASRAPQSMTIAIGQEEKLSQGALPGAAPPGQRGGPIDIFSVDALF
jgi:hypothetical protein